MCGVSAILLGDPDATSAAVDLHESLYSLQHRGQDAAGIAVCQGSRVFQCKGLGLASEVFSDGRRLQQLPGYMGIGHVRYPTMGTASASEAQPLYVNAPFGISLTVNGNVINTEELRRYLDEEAHRHINSDSDSELLDADGIRPLCIGSRPSATIAGANDYFMASESVVLQQLGFRDIVDILPGQAVFCPKGGTPIFRQVVPRRGYTPDTFEYIYVARLESWIDGISVYRSRQKMGEKLAEKIKLVLGEKGVEEIDAIIPVPETSNVAAAALAQKLGKPYVTALVKNRYVHRTFILPDQASRLRSVRRKFSFVESEFQGKNLVIVDDSIVRGTTSRQIVQLAREAGALRVVFVSCSPPCTHPHIYGIDLADRSALIAYNRTQREIADYLGADEVVFLDVDGENGLTAACIEAAQGETPIKNMEIGVFTGGYVTGLPDGYLENLSDLRSGRRQQKAGFESQKAGEGEDGSVAARPAPAGLPCSGEAATPDHREDIKHVKLEALTLRVAADPNLNEIIRRYMEKERLSTEKALQFCTVLSEQIKQIQADFQKNQDSDLTSGMLFGKGLQGCMHHMCFMLAHLEKYQKIVAERLNTSLNAESAGEQASFDKLQNKAKMLQRCLAFCSDVDTYMESQISNIENHLEGDDIIRFLVSIDGKRIGGKNRGTGKRQKQAGGHFREASLQQMSQLHQRGHTKHDTQSSASISGDEPPLATLQSLLGKCHGPGVILD
ncbi:Amidophosphoribosyltransferase [Metarhizium brunneum]|uniref:Amidophosphoribosyltransferase n=1 Tax=Metarhizium brunneum TaxID=500148 RepID=A0A7D5YZJ7_9HYPO|nr:Amidophosphoribosyltransferase [Metarhizium brunneum]